MGGRSGGVGPLLPVLLLLLWLLHPSPKLLLLLLLLPPEVLSFLPEAGSESAAEAATRAAFELNSNISIHSITIQIIDISKVNQFKVNQLEFTIQIIDIL